VYFAERSACDIPQITPIQNSTIRIPQNTPSQQTCTPAMGNLQTKNLQTVAADLQTVGILQTAKLQTGIKIPKK